VALAMCKTPRPPPPNEPPPSVGPPASADPDEARLVASPTTSAPSGANTDAPEGQVSAEAIGLRVGEPLGPVVIAGFRPLADGCLPVLVRAGEGRGQLEIALRGNGPVPAASSERYAVYWDRSTTLTPEILGQAAIALAARLELASAAAPPAGLSTFGAH
jgi:hypothetical protein